MKKNTAIKNIAVTAIMGTISFVLMLLEFPLPFIIPGFIKFDFSELPALITSFALGPFYGVLVCLVKNAIHLFITSTAGIGELANFLLGAVFVFTAGIIYKCNKTRVGAVIASLVGALIMGLLSLPINYWLTYPFYFNFLPKEAVIGMYSAILPAANTLLKALIIFNIPFTFVKGLVDSIICFLIYKKISPILKSKSE